MGDEVDAVVLGIQDDQKISLGLRQLDVNPWDVPQYPPGARVRGKP